MSFLNIFGSSETQSIRMTTDQEDYDKGIELLNIFHNASKQYSNYQFSFDDLLNSIDSNPEQQRIKIQGIGLAYNVQDKEFMDMDKAAQAMIDLANLAQGQIPDKYTTYANAIGNKAQDYSFIDAISYTITESTSDISTGISKTASFVAGNIKYVPYLLAAGLVIYLYMQYKTIKKVIRT